MSKLHSLNLLKLVIPLFFPLAVLCQSSDLKLSEIMSGNEYIGQQPSDFVWAANSEKIYFKWNKENELTAPHYSYSLKEKKLEKIRFKMNPHQPVKGYWQDGINACTFFKVGSSIYKQDGNNKEEVYTNSQDYRIHAVLGSNLIIEQGKNMFALNTEKPAYIQLTNFEDGFEPTSGESQTYLEQEEAALFETISHNKAKKRAEKQLREDQNPKFSTPFYLEGWSLNGQVLSQDLKQCIFIRTQHESNIQTTYTRHITNSGYAKAESARAKVGAKNPKHELYVWNLKENKVSQVHFNQLSGLDKIPEYYSFYPNQEINDYEKELIYHIHGINDSGDKSLVEIKSYDNKDRWIGYVELWSAAFQELDHQHDQAWIGGPGITGWKSVPGTMGWIDDENFFFQSEKSGYSHLYMGNCNNKKTIALTAGEFEIHEAQLSEDHKVLYISANKNHPGNREFYALDIASKKMTPLLTKDGNHEVLISPNEKWLLVNYSYKNNPWDLYLAPNKKNAPMEQITASESKKFKTYNWREPEVIQFKASDDQMVNARIYEPAPENKNGAAVLFVHGAGYLQNAHNWWSGYYREYMFNNMLCDMGFTVLDVDYRASKGYGRDFRTAIYRDMGGKDLSDYMDAREMLIKNYDIDSNRVGIYGGSYGGFITIMALLKEPGKFACGAAVRSVADWAHYNHAYTSNILNTPATDPEAFKKSSPIYYADNLNDRLLMLHGMVDGNVQYQDVARLSQRFIELGKTNWDLVGYPVEPHGFIETTSWTDEYGRILKLFQEELLAD